MKKNILLNVICSLVVSALFVSSGVIVTFIPDDPIDPPCVVSPDDVFPIDKYRR